MAAQHPFKWRHFQAEIIIAKLQFIHIPDAS